MILRFRIDVDSVAIFSVGIAAVKIATARAVRVARAQLTVTPASVITLVSLVAKVGNRDDPQAGYYLRGLVASNRSRTKVHGTRPSAAVAHEENEACVLHHEEDEDKVFGGAESHYLMAQLARVVL